MNKIQDFLKRKGIEDKIVDYDENNEPLTPSYIIQEWEKEQLRIGGVVSSLPTKEEMHIELSKRVEDIKATSSMGANKQMLLAYRIGFEECDDYMRKR